MNFTAEFVLRRDVQLVPCEELSDDVRGRITFDPGDYTLSRLYGRTVAQVIDGETAALLALFREPRTIVEAVVENSRALGKDPEAWLDALLPHLGAFVEKRVLVPAGTEDEHEIRPQFESGAMIAGWKIVRCASLIEDSEVYQLRRGNEVAALKIARSSSASLRVLFENEEAVLRHLDDGDIAPRLLDAGTYEERPYLIVDWVAGTDAATAAAQRRHDRASLIELCASIASAYAELHARGVLHVDVHPRNVIVHGDRATLLDFGYSMIGERRPATTRGGLLAYYEPEFLAGLREGRDVPATARGEQYMLAAMLYFLVAGQHHVEFSYDRAEMTRQAEEAPALSFAERGVAPWPDVERILLRGLEKDPSRRHDSLAGMAALFAAARDTAVRELLATPLTSEAEELLERTLRSFARGGERFVEGFTLAPKATINYGAAGAAIGLLRIAETRGDAALLALADVWRSRAVAMIGTGDDAYYNPDFDLRPDNLGTLTPYHSDSGIHAAAALVSAAMGDTHSHARAIDAFLHTSNRPCAELDLTLGRSGSLLAAALLLDAGNDPRLRTFGRGTMRALWNELDQRPPIAETSDALGIAHGWAGYLYAALRWCASSGDALPPRLEERLHEFAALKTMKGRGVYWRTSVDRPVDSIMPGWCNGTAGQIFLLTLAHRLLGDPEWLRLAELAAWNNWDEPRWTLTTLCCGTAGRAYALLNLYRHTGATEWLSRARQLANHAAAHATAATQHRGALWKGELGVAVLIADLASPENARMPFFE